MAPLRKVEVFSAGCPVCQDTIDLVTRLGCSSCEIVVLDMHKRSVAQRAQQLGVRSLPAVAINGELAACCAGQGPDENTLRTAGLGQA